MSLHRMLAAACAFCLLLGAAPATAAPTGFELKPGVTPEQVGECYVTVLNFLSITDELNQPLPPTWTRLKDYFYEVGEAYGPEERARALAAVQARSAVYQTLAKDRTLQEGVDRLSADTSACGELVLDLE
jgi:hypothetical protein